MRRPLLIRLTSAFAAIAVLAAALPAVAAEPTRESFAAEAEPICKADTKANERILAGVRDLVKKGKYKPAAAKFDKAAQALAKAHDELAALPQPPADKAKLDKWLSYVDQEVAYFEQAAKKLRAGQKAAASQIVVRLNHTAVLANNQVIAFDFKYCKLEPSRFT